MTEDPTTADVLRRTKAALALARGQTTDQAGQEAGVTGRTVRRWRTEDPSFRAEINALRRDMLDGVLGQLGAAAADAVRVLCEVLEEKSPAVRVRAAGLILSTLLTVRESVDVEDRLAALEAGMAERQAAS